MGMWCAENQDFSKKSSETSDHKPFTISKDGYTDSGISLDRKITKITEKVLSADKLQLHFWQSWRSWLRRMDTIQSKSSIEMKVGSSTIRSPTEPTFIKMQKRYETQNGWTRVLMWLGCRAYGKASVQSEEPMCSQNQIKNYLPFSGNIIRKCGL